MRIYGGAGLAGEGSAELYLRGSSAAPSSGASSFGCSATYGGGATGGAVDSNNDATPDSWFGGVTVGFGGGCSLMNYQSSNPIFDE